MMQPRCCLCGEKIKSNEHYFIFRGGRSVCIRCKGRIKHENNSGGIVRNTDDNDSDG